MKACKYFSDKGIKTNVTLVFSPGQAILAAKAGATYVSPFIGRLDDISSDGLSLISEIRQIYDNYGFTTEILAASVRHTMHVIDCAKIGADVMTGPLSAIPLQRAKADHNPRASISIPSPTITRKDQKTMPTGGCSSSGIVSRPITALSRGFSKIILPSPGIPNA